MSSVELVSGLVMSKSRIYELARELGVDNKDVIQCAKRLGMTDKTSHSNSLEDFEADAIRRALIRDAIGTPAEEKVEKITSKTIRSGSLTIVERRGGKIVSRRRRDDVDEVNNVASTRSVDGSVDSFENVDSAQNEETLIESVIVIPEIEESSMELSQEVEDEPVVQDLKVTETESLDYDVTENNISADNLNADILRSGEPLKKNETVSPEKIEKRSEDKIVVAEKTIDQKIGIKTSEPIVTHKGRLPEVSDDVSSAGPKILGRISLPVKKLSEAKLGDEVEEEETEESRRKKSRSKRREVLRKDLVDYDTSESRSSRANSNKKNKKDRRNFVEESAPKHEFVGPKASKRVVRIDEFITVGELAHQMSLKVGDVISKLIGLGILATINQPIDKETATIVADDFGYQVESISFDEVEMLGVEESDNSSVSVPRSPVVTVMGHVDHGKTSLLDYIRSASVADREHGGITQHIGAYQVIVKGDRRITFIDTPGHEAFTAMRVRGAQVTDIVVLVVAADDGVMPQTVEAINHAKAAGVPIIVAVNKIDKADSNPDKVKNQLVEKGLQPEEWGGDTLFFHVSALKGTGISELLEGILLVAEITECTANPAKRAKGVLIEASQKRGRGTVATVLVQDGTLRSGDVFVAGAQYGRVRSMMNHLGERIEEATPSMPVEITGFNGVPSAGNDLIVVESEQKARQIAENRAEKLALAERARESGPITLEEFSRRAQQAVSQELAVVLKADVDGSVEAVKQSLERLSTDKVKVKVVHSAVGGITESDVQLAIASQAIILGFGVRAEPRAMTDAESAGVGISFYRVIYELLDDVKKAMVGLLEPTKEEVYLGRAEVRDTFSVPKVGTIAGCYVTDGIIKRGVSVRVLRDNTVVYEGRLGSLRRFKEDVKQVQSGYECGMNVENFNDVKISDILEVFEHKEVAAVLD
jgi:translation initiation factor IF-2